MSLFFVVIRMFSALHFSPCVICQSSSHLNLTIAFPFLVGWSNLWILSAFRWNYISFNDSLLSKAWNFICVKASRNKNFLAGCFPQYFYGVSIMKMFPSVVKKRKDWWAYWNSSLDMQSNQPRPAAAVGFEASRLNVTQPPTHQPRFFHKPLGL